jgi:hypothetical protein
MELMKELMKELVVVKRMELEWGLVPMVLPVVR